jgi:hypothetical protein
MVLSLPGTRPGLYSVGLAATFVILFIINAAVFLPARGGVAGSVGRHRATLGGERGQVE